MGQNGSVNIPLNKSGVGIMKITTVGLDIAKSIFHSYAINHTGRLIRKKQLKRKQLLAYFSKLEPSIVVMEACGGANYWQESLLNKVIR
jgi:transposase